MRRIIKLSALIFGSISLMLGFSSCKKEEEPTECCTMTYTDTVNEKTYSTYAKMCEDGYVSYTYTYGSRKITYSGNWKEYYEEYTWDEIKDYYFPDC